MRSRSLLSVAALAAFVSVAGASCLSPTLPLPPPDVPSTIIAGAAPGTWEVFGTCDPGATVTVIDVATGNGVVHEDRGRTGSYHLTLVGAKCDWAQVTQQVDGTDSDATAFQLAVFMPGDSGDPANNDACQ